MRRRLAAAASALAATIGTALDAAADERPWTLTGYAFRLTDNNWRGALWPGTVQFIDAGAVALAFGRQVATMADDRIAIEVEGTVARHFGDQDNWEFAIPVIARWQAFPWNDTVDTSIAWGAGLSWATEEPATEAARSDKTQQLMVYWVLEATAGPPDANWEAVFRLHHRSGGYGLIADEGGSNGLGLGVKYRF